jgi:hypothetical protein
LKNVLAVLPEDVLSYGMGARRGRQGRARYLFREKDTDEDGNLTEAVIWRVPVSTSYPEGVRYRLAFIRSEEHTPAVLYDNHHPKGHHRHLRRKTGPYGFRGVDRLLQDFRSDVARIREGKL